MSSECPAQEKPFSHLFGLNIHPSFSCGPGGAALPSVLDSCLLILVSCLLSLDSGFLSLYRTPLGLTIHPSFASGPSGAALPSCPLPLAS